MAYCGRSITRKPYLVPVKGLESRSADTTCKLLAHDERAALDLAMFGSYTVPVIHGVPITKRYPAVGMGGIPLRV